MNRIYLMTEPAEVGLFELARGQPRTTKNTGKAPTQIEHDSGSRRYLLGAYEVTTTPG